MHRSSVRPLPVFTSRFTLCTIVFLGALAGEAAFRRAAAAAPDPVLVARADSLYAAQAWGPAGEAYRSLAEAAGNNGRLWYRYGSCLHQSGHLDDAIHAYEKAEAIAHNPTVMYNLSCALTSSGRTADALAWLEKAAAAGFNQVSLLDADKELVPLHDNPRYEAVRTAMDRSAHPCAYDPSYRQLDFWIGDWNVTTPTGGPAGRSHVEMILGQCVIFENWTGFAGGSGKSFNIIDPVTHQWRQTWVSETGELHEYSGAFEDGAMRYHMTSKDAAGNVILHKMTFFPLAPDLVRQLGESSTDNGATWTVAYDLHYHRIAGSSTTTSGSSGR